MNKATEEKLEKLKKQLDLRIEAVMVSEQMVILGCDEFTKRSEVTRVLTQKLKSTVTDCINQYVQQENNNTKSLITESNRAYAKEVLEKFISSRREPEIDDFAELCRWREENRGSSSQLLAGGYECALDDLDEFKSKLEEGEI